MGLVGVLVIGVVVVGLAVGVVGLLVGVEVGEVVGADVGFHVVSVTDLSISQVAATSVVFK